MERAASRPSRRTRTLLAVCGLAVLAGALAAPGRSGQPAAAPQGDDYARQVRPLLTRYCLGCHSTAKKKGDLDLERFATTRQVREDQRPWQSVLEMLENGEMPPKKSPQPAPDERRRLAAGVRRLLDAEARSRAGDPGRVVVRRLSNAEYDNTVRDLTGVDLHPARDFPVDGSAGEGFTNAGDALVMSPTLLNKYLNAAKEIAAHAVLLPDGFRFSPSATRRDWTDEVLAELKAFYSRYTPDGKLPLRPYLEATVRHRDRLATGVVTPEAVAALEGMNPKYLRTLCQVLLDERPSFPLDRLREHWRRARPQDVAALVAEVSAWQAPLWKYNIIGSYRDHKTLRQEPADPAFVASHALRFKPKPAPGQSEVVLYLATYDLSDRKDGGHAVWHWPRFEAAGEAPLLLKDVGRYAGRFAIDYRRLFADTPAYLAAALEAAHDRTVATDALAAKHRLDAALLQRWVDVLALVPPAQGPLHAEAPRQMRPAVPLQILGRKLEVRNPTVWGWGTDGPDTLPAAFANSADRIEYIPGAVPPHKVAVHPTPTRFVAASWTSPVDAAVRVECGVAHAHPACGNGVAWWLEHRRAGRGVVLDGGVLDLGQKANPRPRTIQITKGDQVVLAIGARDLDHSCDLTAIDLTVTEASAPGRAWDLGRDLADTVTQGNPHADRLGNKDVWCFVRGEDPTAVGKPIVTGPMRGAIPRDSILAKWRDAASEPGRRQELDGLAAQVRELLTGSRPAREKTPDRLLYDLLVSLDGPLLRGIDLPCPANAAAGVGGRYGVTRAKFGGVPAGEDGMVVPANAVVEVRVPAGLFRDHEFVAEGRPDPAGGDGVVQFRVLTAPPPPDAPLDGAAPCVAAPGGQAAERLRAGLSDFRSVFPPFVCYERVIPNDEVICLKLYHREDDELARLFLGRQERQHLDRLWAELRHVSRWPVTEYRNLPTFIGFVTQDGDAPKTAFYEAMREPFRVRAEEFEREAEAASPKQLAALTDFASRAYRRPLNENEKTELSRLYGELRKKGLTHEEAFRTTLTRVLVSPSFLFRVEQPAAGNEARPLSDWELATRLSYFLWASSPDETLRRAAAESRLHDPRALAAQVARMLHDPGVRGLGAEFGAQWAHVRDITRNREKNEKLFPTFDDALRQALSEEAVRFFQHLFQADRPWHELIDADWTFLNETLARHYAVPGVTGPSWRLVGGVRQYGRGGVLALGAVQATQSGASRTSPVLRGNWLVEVLLGEKLPKPPPNVPLLPENESTESLSVRQLVEKHAGVPECAVCHRRIDPFGFALERYDPIGRFRDKDLAGRPIDARARLKDGTEFDGIDGLRNYLLTQRRDEVERQFLRKLLGYALGRSVTLSDQPLLDEIVDELHKNDGRLSVAVQAIVRSKQFRSHRGLEATRDE